MKNKQPKMFAAAGFDLGDTLIEYLGVPLNWQAFYPQVLAEVAARCGLDPDEQKLDRAAQVLLKYNTRANPRTREVTDTAIFSEVLALWSEATPDRLASAIETFFAFFQQRVRVFPDALPLLQELKRRGIPTGIFTDVPYGMHRALVEQDAAPLLPWVDTLLTSVEVGYRKPERVVFEALAGKLGATPDCMIYVGNEEKDITGARNAGIFAVLLNRSGLGLTCGEDLKITSLAELVGLFTPSTQ